MAHLLHKYLSCLGNLLLACPYKYLRFDYYTQMISHHFVRSIAAFKSGTQHYILKERTMLELTYVPPTVCIIMLQTRTTKTNSLQTIHLGFLFMPPEFYRTSTFEAVSLYAIQIARFWVRKQEGTIPKTSSLPMVFDVFPKKPKDAISRNVEIFHGPIPILNYSRHRTVHTALPLSSRNLSNPDKDTGMGRGQNILVVLRCSDGQRTEQARESDIEH